MTCKYKLAPQLVMSGRAALLVCAIVVGSCSPDSSGSLEPTGTPSPSYRWGQDKRDRTHPRSLVKVSVAPDSALLAPVSQQVFTATGTLNNGSTVKVAVTWEVRGGGRIDSTGLYHASSTQGKYAVVARADNGLADTAAVSVEQPKTGVTVARVILSPSAASVPVGSSQAFTSSALMSDSTVGPATVSYVATGGTISPAGLYKAGQTPGTYRVIGTAQSGKSDTVAVAITPVQPMLQQIVLSPATVSLAPGALQQFTASGKLSDGSTAPVIVTYTATGGSVTTSGSYTAGGSGGTYRVIATGEGAPHDSVHLDMWDDYLEPL